MFVDASTLSPAETERLLVGSVVPRPIAWITSAQPGGPVNLAPFSSFAWVSQHPAYLGFTISRRAERAKDTFRNIESAGEYVVNIADDSMLDQLHASSEMFPPEIGEADALGLRLAPSERVAVPRLADAPISMECRFDRAISFSPTGGEFVVGEVLAWHVADEVMREGRIDSALLRPIARLAGQRYSTISDVIEFPAMPGV